MIFDRRNPSDPEYRIVFYVNGSLWDVIAAYDRRWLWAFAMKLCQKYAAEGEVSIIGETHV